MLAEHGACLTWCLFRLQFCQLLPVPINQEPVQKVFDEIADRCARVKIPDHQQATGRQLIIKIGVQRTDNAVIQVVVQPGAINQIIMRPVGFALSSQKILDRVANKGYLGAAVMKPPHFIYFLACVSQSFFIEIQKVKLRVIGQG